MNPDSTVGERMEEDGNRTERSGRDAMEDEMPVCR